MRRHLRTMIVLVVALAAATISSLIVYRALRARPPVREAATVATVVAAHALPEGTLVTEADVKVARWPASLAVPGALGTASAVTGRGLLAAVLENEPITEGVLAPPGAGAGLPPAIPDGMRAISVRVDDVVGVAGFVTPGTHVDVLATLQHGDTSLARIIVGNTLVMAMGMRDETQSEGRVSRGATVATLLVTPEDAERIAVVASAGQIVLTLRHPWDTDVVATEGTSISQLMGIPAAALVPDTAAAREIAPPEAAPQQLVAPPQPVPYTVDAIRGPRRTREVVP